MSMVWKSLLLTLSLLGGIAAVIGFIALLFILLPAPVAFGLLIVGFVWVMSYYIMSSDKADEEARNERT